MFQVQVESINPSITITAYVDLSLCTDNDDFVRHAQDALQAEGAKPGHAFIVSDVDQLPDQFEEEGQLEDDVWEFLEDTQSLDINAVLAFVEFNGEWSTDRFNETYKGEFNSLAAFAANECEEEPPTWLSIDWEQSGQNLMVDHTEINDFYFRR